MAVTIVATLGVTGQAGSDNSHFNWPVDVEMDASGNIYVADTLNRRVQIFNRNRVWQMTLGKTGEWSDDFNHFNDPTGVAVDARDNIYVAANRNPFTWRIGIIPLLWHWEICHLRV